MTRRKQSRGEDKTGICQICQQPFAKTRYDAKFCSAPCAKEGLKFYKRVAWYDRPDREEQNRARRERYYAKRPEHLAKLRQWRAEHPEEAKAKYRARYEANKAKHIAKTAAYRKAHPEVRQKEYRNARAKRPWERPLANSAHRAAKKKLAFDLTREWCERTWTGYCALSGLPFSFGTQTHYPFAPSIDRIDSTKGYTQDNCRFILFAINSFKGVGTDEQMFEIAKSLISHQKADPCKL